MTNRTKAIVIAVFFLAAFVLILNLGMNKPLDHDENQFVASAALLERDGTTVYLDYPYFHLPYLTYVYALLFTGADRLLFSARLFSTVCSFLGLLLIFFTAYSLFSRYTETVRFLIAAGSVVLLLGNPLFTYTTGLAWNYDFPVLLMLLAFVLHARNIRRDHGYFLTFASGVLIGLSTGVRLTFVLVFIPFLIVPFLYGGTISRQRLIRLSIYLGAGFLLALLPLVFIFLRSPDSFLFGNLGYPELNTLYREAQGYTRTMNLSLKIVYTLELLGKAGSLMLLCGAGLFVFRKSLLKGALSDKSRLEVIFALIIIPFLLAGAYAPTPVWRQYFYPIVPFLLLAVIHGASWLDEKDPRVENRLKVFGLFVLVFGFLALPQYPATKKVGHSIDWIPMEIHNIGQQLAAKMGRDGKVLTLVPIIPLEAGLDIYPEFVTGPFAWRTAGLLTPGERAKYRMISGEELVSFLESDPPKAFVQGFEGQDEEPLVDYAKRHLLWMGYLNDGRPVWVAPE